jgi:hypothetical protein
MLERAVGREKRMPEKFGCNGSMGWFFIEGAEIRERYTEKDTYSFLGHQSSERKS